MLCGSPCLEAQEKQLERHPLIALANSRDVKQAKGFRGVAEGLSGQSLDELYKQEVANAPRRKEAGKKHFGSHPKGPTGRRTASARGRLVPSPGRSMDTGATPATSGPRMVRRAWLARRAPRGNGQEGSGKKPIRR